MLRGCWKKFIGAFCALAILGGVAGAQEQAEPAFEAAKLFTNHMVFQRDAKLPVWGWAKPGTKVTVTLAGNSAEAVAGEDGKWMAWLPPLPAGGPHELVIEGPTKLTIADVLVGDVWICSGQSNMEFPVGNSMNRQEEVDAANYPQIRQFGGNKTISYEPQQNSLGSWSVCSPKTVAGWTAVGYFFGRDLYKQLNIPIGLINVSWGGTRVEAWTSEEVAKKLPGTEKDFAAKTEIEGHLDELKAKVKEQEVAYKEGWAKLAELEKDAAHQAKYADPAFDDSGWKDLKPTADYDEQGYRGVHGECWFRKTVEIPADWAGKDLEFSPGAIDEIATLFFNGKQVGVSGSFSPMDTSNWNLAKTYRIPAELVKPGKGVIAIRVVNVYGQGGLCSSHNPDDMFFRPVGEKKGLDITGPWKFDFVFKLPREPYKENANTICVLYNGMINPLIPFPVKGAIWYQGESNSGNAYDYRVRFPAMIQDWRARWGTDFPFFWVQLANFRAPQVTPLADSWAVVRESQEKTLALPATGTGLAIDVGDAKDIHPKNKQEVGRRLALAARGVAYGEKDLVYSGPRYKSMKAEGGKIRLSFDHVGGGLVAKDGDLKRFAIAGADQKFVWAQAVIDGDTVVVSAEEVAEPVAVRYAFETNPEGCNLYNKEGLPASPFRTDEWLVPTQPQEQGK